MDIKASATYRLGITMCNGDLERESKFDLYPTVSTTMAQSGQNQVLKVLKSQLRLEPDQLQPTEDLQPLKLEVTHVYINAMAS